MEHKKSSLAPGDLVASRYRVEHVLGGQAARGLDHVDIDFRRRQSDGGQVLAALVGRRIVDYLAHHFLQRVGVFVREEAALCTHRCFSCVP